MSKHYSLSLKHHLLSEEENLDGSSRKGGTHTFHGNRWSPEKVGPELAGKGPRFEDDVAVTDEDLEKAKKWLEKYEPDHIIAYSRGSAVLHKLAAQNPDIDIPQITYVAPAAKRDKWGAKGIKAPSVSGRVIASAGDGAVPLKQACAIADEAGVDMFVTPGEFKSDNWELEGRKNHIRVLNHRNSPSPGVKIDPGKCANSSELPDKGDGFFDEEELKQQTRGAADLAGDNVTPEDLGMPSEKTDETNESYDPGAYLTARLTPNNFHRKRTNRMKITDAIYGRGKQPGRKLTESELRKLVLREFVADSSESEEAWALKYEDFVKKLGSTAGDPKTKAFIGAGLRDGKKEDDVFKFTEKGIPVKQLKPTQNEIDIEKSLKFPIEKNPSFFVKYLEGAGTTFKLGSPIVTYNGEFIIDGHHRWSQLYACQDDSNIESIDITTSEDLDPLTVLKSVQSSIAYQTGGVPVQSVKGSNLLEIGKDALYKWIKLAVLGAPAKSWFKKPGWKPMISMMNDQSGKSLATSADLEEKANKGYSKDELKELVKATQDYIWSNVLEMRKTSQPVAGAPKRDFMPQTDDIDWQAPLKAGVIDPIAPHGDLDVEVELEGTNESIDLRRWNRLAGLLRG